MPADTSGPCRPRLVEVNTHTVGALPRQQVAVSVLDSINPRNITPSYPCRSAHEFKDGAPNRFAETTAANLNSSLPYG